MDRVPIRVDFAGGWLDVPSLARPGAYIVNCTFSPCVSLDEWPYHRPASGIGSSAAWRILQGQPGIDSELDAGAGWQDPAVILETGLCVWRSGVRPVLECKINPDFLSGICGLLWVGERASTTPDLVTQWRDYNDIERAGKVAAEAALCRDFGALTEAIHISYLAQLDEGMPELPQRVGAHVRKYCGTGWGGYAFYLFGSREARDASGLEEIEPYMKDFGGSS